MVRSNFSPRLMSQGARMMWGRHLISSSISDVEGREGDTSEASFSRSSVMTSARMSPVANSRAFLAPRGILECGSSGSSKQPGGLSRFSCAWKLPGGRSGPEADAVPSPAVGGEHEGVAEVPVAVEGGAREVEEGLFVGRCDP